MKLLAHRGHWKTKEDQNTLEAFKVAVKRGFGIEFDVRDFQGDIIISHDPYLGESPLLLRDFMDYFKYELVNKCLAINIKSDGIAPMLLEIIDFKKYPEIFCFDMSVPQMRDYEIRNITIGYRISEFENLSLLLKWPKILWIDSFDSIWYKEDDIINLLQNNSKLCFVSEELHGRDPHYQWALLKKICKYASCHPDMSEKLFLCTDYFVGAEEYFNEN